MCGACVASRWQRIVACGKEFTFSKKVMTYGSIYRADVTRHENEGMEPAAYSQKTTMYPDRRPPIYAVLYDNAKRQKDPRIPGFQ
jgi:hypothetical protein